MSHFRPLRLLCLLLVASCVSPQTTTSAPSATPPTEAVRHTAVPTVPPTPSPTLDPRAVHIADLLQILAIRDRALLSGDPQQVVALLDPSSSPEFRERDIGLAKIAAGRKATAPRREIVDFSGGLGSPLGLEIVLALETDDQGRTRQVRYFLDNAGSTRFAEPAPDRLGVLRTRAAEGYLIRSYEIDAGQAEAADLFAREALTSLVTRLGEDYRSHRPFSITLAPTTIAGLPVQASGYTNGTEITLLSSASMVVAIRPGSDWAKKVVTHEIAHVLLFARGGGPWVMVEGIPLWLTDDHRQPELDRLVAANAIWDLPHLLEGPRTPEEFFAAYAQASSFVRYLAARYGDGAVIAVWEAGRTKPTFEEAFRAGFGVAPSDAWTAWRASLRPPA